MLQIEVEGTIIKALELRSGTSARTGNEWRRQDYVIETPGQYPRKCQFTVADGNIDMFNLQEGNHIKVTISIDAHEYNGRWFNDFRATNVEQPTATVPPIGVNPMTGAPMGQTVAPIGAPQAQPAAPAPSADPLSGDSSALPWE